MFCLLYSPKQKIVKFHAQKQIGKSHVIDIFTSSSSSSSSELYLVTVDSSGFYTLMIK
jgi:hypothetical protein